MMVPFGTDVFLPSLPAFARAYDIPIGAAELTLASFFSGSALGQLLWGPLADRFGRKPIVLIAAVGYIASAVCVLLCESFTPVILWRFVQGITAASGRILANAVARDLYERERLAKLIAFIMTVSAISALFTGPMGGFVADHYSWQAAFWLPAAVGVLLVVLFAALFRETITERNPLAIRPVPLVLTMGGILRSPIFLSYVLTSGCGMAGLSAFVNSSAGMLIGRYGVSPSLYGLIYAALPIGFMLGSICAGRLVEKLGANWLLALGSTSMAAAGLAMLAMAMLDVRNPWLVVAPMMPYLFGYACVIPQTSSGALTPFGRHAGTASSLQGFIQSMIAAVMSAMLALSANGTLYPMAIAIALAGILTLACYLSLIRPRRS
jgi:DHA1 family bicyclomycin/chloramphenicol resistance-like MFS transporter